MSAREKFFGAIKAAGAGVVAAPFIASHVAMAQDTVSPDALGPARYVMYYQVAVPTEFKIPQLDKRRRIIHDKYGKIVYVPKRDAQNNIMYDDKHHPILATKTVPVLHLRFISPLARLSADYTDASGTAQQGDIVTLPSVTASDIMVQPAFPDYNFAAASAKAIQLDGNQGTAAVTRDGNKNHPSTVFVFPDGSKCEITGVGIYNEGDLTRNYHPPSNYDSDGQRFRILQIKTKCTPAL